MSNISTNLAEAGRNLYYLPQCQSTNDVLAQYIAQNEEHLPDGFVIYSDFQTAGRGQRGNSWDSEPRKNLMFSLHLRPNFLEARYSFWLSAAVSLAIVQVLNTRVTDCMVKWPNDIMVNGKKLGGILIENSVVGMNLDQSIVGIGLNINQINLPDNATSLAQIRQLEFDRLELLLQIRDEIMLMYHRLKAEGWEKIRLKYYTRLYKIAIPHDYYLPDGTTFPRGFERHFRKWRTDFNFFGRGTKIPF